MALIDLDRVHIMAIVNVTDDSFYSASRVASEQALERRIAEVVEQGATIIDIGGYSSRPGADDIDLETEWSRVDLGVGVARRVAPNVAVSVDTFRAEIVRRTVEKYGEIIVNDITAGEADSDMVALVAEHNLTYVAMHMRSVPKSMQDYTDYDDVVAEVVDYLKNRAAELEHQGVRRENIILDPGFGFGKTLEHNYTLLRQLEDFRIFDLPLLIGISRKSMITKPLDITADEALNGTTALNAFALMKGAHLLRVHDVKAAVEVVKLFERVKI